MSFIYDMADTWNAGATTFTAIKMNVTNTASAAASKLIDLQIGGVTRFNIQNDSMTWRNSAGSGFDLTDAAGIMVFTTTSNQTRFTSTFGVIMTQAVIGTAGDTLIGRKAAGIIDINQAAAVNTSATTTITNGADSSSNLGHRAQISFNGTTYWFPCGAVAF